MPEEKVGDNGKLGEAGTPDLGHAGTPNLGHAGDPLKKKPEPEIKKEPPKDYKIAEVWIKDGTVAIEASPQFWMDKLRAIGILYYCQKIVEDYNPADQRKKSLIQKVNMQGFRNFIRGRK